MKTMYEYLYPVGCKVWENMPDDFPEGVPYTSVPPLPDVPLDRQFWNPRERKWEEVITQDVSKQLALLEEIATGIKKENQTLKATVDENTQQLTDTQMALADVYEIIEGGKLE
ncbi:hypothetical protein NXK88_001938 [Enterococcus hirae]|uniref:hypothetical protein n=1 Tax=Enterococcus hirae TaxID=1354 RepID=UPI0020734A52|nr:hypothetical protein [Enterococcus hirae]EMF0202710.1 hypothetical protein [Enterococcus hirae]